MRPKRGPWSFVGPILVGVVALLLWLLFAARMETSYLREGVDPDAAVAVRRAILPLPSEIWEATTTDAATLSSAAWNTFVAALLGFLTAGTGGYLLALTLSLTRLLRTAFYPWVLVVQMTPLIVVAPIIALWVRQPPLAAVVLATFLLGFFPVLANALHGFATVPRRLEELFTVCRARSWQTFWHLRVPHSLPAWFTGLKIAATLSPVGALFADLFVGSADRSPGLGFQILIYKNTLNTPGLFAAALVACAMGFVFVGIVRLLRVLCLRRWAETAHSSPS